MKKFAWLLLSLGLLVSTPMRGDEPAPDPTPDTPFHMIPAKFVGWWHVGDTVTYRVAGGQVPTGVDSIQGDITDTDGKAIESVSVKTPDLDEKGWQWTPKDPGFYQVAFSYTDGGTKTPVTQSFIMKASADASRPFSRSQCDFAVLPAESADPTPLVGQFGFDYGNDLKQIQLAKLIGFDLARLSINWGAGFTNLNAGVESVQGEDHWELLDPHVDALSQNGFLINGQFCYTPLWASPHPEKTDVKICVVEGTTYAPKNMDDFGNFVEATVTRYKDKIHLWEMWNEQSIPGGSVFWEDTPENYFSLLQTGYKAVKKIQPDAEVWLGGMGPRPPYHVFYNKLLKMGGDKYFDVLSLHGQWNSPVDKFYVIDTNNGVAHKPAIEGEWHAILMGSHAQSDDAIVTDPALSLKMMKDLFYQLKGGVSRSILFEMTNLSEKETLDYATDNKLFTHSSGLFRRRPQIEPRHPAVVMANFLQLSGRKATFVKEFKLSDRSIAVQLTTGKGPLVAVWSESDPLTLASIKAFASPQSELHDWEGRVVPLDQADPLPANKLYYLSAPNTDLIAKAETTNLVISPKAVAGATREVVHGLYTDGKLFNSLDTPTTIPDSAWLQKDWQLTKLIEADHDENFSARAAVGAYADGVDIVVEVHDKTQSQTETQPDWWKGDSVQIAFDCEGSGTLGGNTELLTALTDAGPVLWKTKAADPHGDIPSSWSPAKSLVKNADQRIVRTGDIIRYQIRIPWTELYPLTYDNTKPLRVSFVVNNNNGNGQAEYLAWGGGLAKGADPSFYGLLQTPAAAASATPTPAPTTPPAVTPVPSTAPTK